MMPLSPSLNDKKLQTVTEKIISETGDQRKNYEEDFTITLATMQELLKSIFAIIVMVTTDLHSLPYFGAYYSAINQICAVVKTW